MKTPKNIALHVLLIMLLFVSQETAAEFFRYHNEFNYNVSTGGASMDKETVQSNSESNTITLRLKIVDALTGEIVPARVLIQDPSGNSLIPVDAVTLQVGQETWFMCPGISEIHATSRHLLLRIERGKEYLRIKKELHLEGSNTEELNVMLRRWIHMAGLGYVSAENHLHQNARDVAAMCAAEDLTLGTSLQWWNYPRFEVQGDQGNLRILKFGGVSIPVSVYDVEMEEAWGALYIINLPGPFPFEENKQMPNLPGAVYGRKHGALNCYQAGWSREVLVDALLGYIDVVNVCNNNFHMHRFQPRSRYSNLLNVEGLPTYPDSPKGMMQMNTDTYYRLLNCGIRLAAGAGSATGAKETPAGFNRAYIRSDLEEGIQQVYQNWKAGRNFVTNGPMLFLSTSEGLKPGDSLNFKGTKTVSLHLEAVSDSPLDLVEIVVNGKVVGSIPAGGEHRFEKDFNVILSESAWVCARCTDTDIWLDDSELEKYRSPQVNLNQEPNRLRYAHTSPIYFYKGGNGIAVGRSVIEGLKMIAAFREFAKENVSTEYREAILQAADKAMEILMNRLKDE